MAVTSTNAAVDPALNAMLDQFDGGVLQIRTGAPPGAGAAPTGTVLAQITLPNPAFAAASGKSKGKAGTWADSSADSAGTAEHFRIVAPGDTGTATQNEPRLEGTVTGSGGGGDIELNNPVLAAGQEVEISSFAGTGATS